jgi:hypothetical protein
VFNAELYSTLSWSLEKVERYEVSNKALKIKIFALGSGLATDAALLLDFVRRIKGINYI